MPEGEVENPEEIQAHIRPEIGGAVGRARRAGASGPLRFVGAGMYGIVLCDLDGRAWKVARLPERSTERHADWMREAFAEEYEWLRDAAGSGIRDYVALVYDFHPDEIVVERECVFGRPGGWSDEGRLAKLHREIERVMVPLGWNAPEFKGDSYIIQEDGTPKLVDISMVQRLGRNLLAWILEVLAGRRLTHETWHSLAFYVLREMREKAVTESEGCAVLEELVKRDPAIAKGFRIPCPGR
jgi:hypothetical protein